MYVVQIVNVYYFLRMECTDYNLIEDDMQLGITFQLLKSTLP